MRRLTAEQLRIVEHSGGHALVRAVPGSGKTTTLVKRVQSLVNQGVRNEAILILMFNRSARNDFLRKLQLALKTEEKLPKVRTFHSHALAIVHYAEKSGLLPKKQLIQPNDSLYKKILQEAYRRAISSEDNYVGPEYLQHLELFISSCRAEMLSSDELFADPKYKNVSNQEKLAYKYYEELVRDHGVRTFDDLITEAITILAENPQLTKHFSYVIVDEYQDINFAQQLLVQHHAHDSAEVMAVGDINQCIYEWRGSRPDFIDGIFERTFKGAKTYHLSSTFRYGHALSLVANSVIGKNKRRTNKLCLSHSSAPKTDIELITNNDEFSALREITSHLSSDTETTAILARSHADLTVAQISLELLGISYTRHKALSGIENRTEIATLLVVFDCCLTGGVLTLAAHPSIDKIVSEFVKGSNFRLQKGGLRQLIVAARSRPESFLQELESVLQKNYASNLTLFRALKAMLASTEGNTPATNVYIKLEAAEFFARVGHLSAVLKEAEDSVRGLRAISRLFQSSDISVGQFIEVVMNPKTPTRGGAVALSTIHSAKGLEWDNVVIVGLYDAEFPGREDQIDNPLVQAFNPISGECEEERRVFYVAITRARKGLFFIAPEDPLLTKWLRSGWYSTPKRNVIATRFLYECNVENAVKASQALELQDLGSKVLVENKLCKSYAKLMSSTELRS